LATAGIHAATLQRQTLVDFLLRGNELGRQRHQGSLFGLQLEADTWDVASGITCRDVEPGGGATCPLFFWPPQLTGWFSSHVTHTIILQKPSCGKASLPPRRRTEVLENRRFGFARLGVNSSSHLARRQLVRPNIFVELVHDLRSCLSVSKSQEPAPLTRCIPPPY
jgi:hypothetical protein